MYLISMVIVIAGSVLYHLAQKSMPPSLSPLLNITITYITALSLSLIGYLVLSKVPFAEDVKHLNFAPLLLGGSIFLIELGFLLVYRAGWSISIAPLFANLIVVIILLLLGSFFFKEPLSTTKLLGFVLSIAGLLLLSKK